jgi:hypothetical protein
MFQINDTYLSVQEEGREMCNYCEKEGNVDTFSGTTVEQYSLVPILLYG